MLIRRFRQYLHLRPWMPFALALAMAFPSLVRADAIIEPLVRIAPRLLHLLAPLARSSRTLAKEEIIELSRLARTPGGTRALGTELARRGLTGSQIEDAYLRIAIHQGTIDRMEAERLFRTLSGTPGFTSTLRKVVGNNPFGTSGHMFELRLAARAAESGFKVREIGRRFADGLKRAPSDIDVLLERKGRLLAIEAKNYAPGRPIPLDMARADMATLAEFERQASSPVIPVFVIANRLDPAKLKLLQHAAERQGVELITGDAVTAMAQIDVLSRIQ